MSETILVAYASKMGSTAEVAAAIGQTLTERGANVEVRSMQEVVDLSQYRAVVAGSAIRGGKWLPEAMDFLRANRLELSRKPFAAFMVCITLGSANEKYREGVKAWMDPVRSIVRPASEGHFAGKLDLNQVPFGFNSLAFRAAVAMGALPKGDHRDWTAIRAWAAGLSSTLG